MQRMPPFSGGFFYGEDANIFKKSIENTYLKV
jgi:hypothetical protein